MRENKYVYKYDNYGYSYGYSREILMLLSVENLKNYVIQLNSVIHWALYSKT
jgi:hypothetical protein